MATKLDLKKTEKAFYKPSTKAYVTVDVPAMNYLMIDGKGNPGTSQDFQDAVEALYGVAYKLKFMTKAEQDFTVMPLEGLWWAEDMDTFLADTLNKDAWLWTMMIRQPGHISTEHFNIALEAVASSKNPVALPKLRFESYDEGLCAQIMYIGPYTDEGPTIAGLHGYIEAEGYHLHGKHHEIYISDMRRTAPEKLKTVIRQPMR